MGVVALFLAKGSVLAVGTMTYQVEAATITQEVGMYAQSNQKNLRVFRFSRKTVRT